MSDAASRPAATGRRRRGAVGWWLVAVAVALLALGLLSLPWFRNGSGFFRSAGDDSFYELHLALNRLRVGTDRAGLSDDVHFGFAAAYFTWIGWTCAGVALLLGVVSLALPRRLSAPVRVLGGLVAATGVGCTVAALGLVFYTGPTVRRMPDAAPSFADYLGHSWFGAWCVVLGFALLCAACVLGRATPASARASASSLAAARPGD